MSPIVQNLALQPANPSEACHRTRESRRPRGPGQAPRPLTAHASLVLAALEVFPGSSILETTHHRQPEL